MNGLSGIGMTSQRTRTRMIERLREQGIKNEQALTAMASVPRHIFVDAAAAHRAYEDTALPLILGQTISQPYIVARMIELLLDARDKLGKTLEIGAGCGYQTAVLAQLTREVFGVERLAPLLARARENLKQLKLPFIRLKHADGMAGLPEAAPFDSIIVAAAGVSVPQSLREQLAPGGRLVIPVGGQEQVLCMIERTPQGWVETRFDAVRFVPLLPGVG
ncbi:MAG: protein-L-isoaspartate(D-aspartate) O-methyltransferase [Gammaproteobacteria bacterium]|nr:protein-L-isoaspartate(D-aspartate) O-methyltransferase [Rhodocyclaceae bacterium]MBU3908461.1 protein-L-isoaspartate(D-aspartate) O-methyltransferase [Gammaproteobacteria bacterium]MBU3990290.1 protein-L-isoaspartate(D-aspartate) O-methyltransferase [Gammaproteobacteria bacterium]MBU4005407.1 protein-L-isoaspartate(D-aspartate) O-methyltransferase [Gammaproteobacteria bacterium]MBU4021092.1 protein-L-isoaspartate(D-aspartate) O-methyltransferase [Gammaproteobacteria bacterium]